MRVKTGRHRNQDCIIGKRPEQIFVDVAQRRPAETDRRGHIGQSGIHQNNVRRIDRHVRPGSDRDAGVRPGQRRRVVDAVADHRHAAPFLKGADHSFLAVRKHPRDDAVHTGLLPDRLRGPLVVAGQHDNLGAHPLHFLHGLR